MDDNINLEGLQLHWHLNQILTLNIFYQFFWRIFNEFAQYSQDNQKNHEFQLYLFLSLVHSIIYFIQLIFIRYHRLKKYLHKLYRKNIPLIGLICNLLN